MPPIFADLNKSDGNRVLLTCVGTRADLDRYGITLESGMKLTFYMPDEDENNNRDDLIFEGIVAWDETPKCLVAVVDWDKIRPISVLSNTERAKFGLPIDVRRGSASPPSIP